MKREFQIMDDFCIIGYYWIMADFWIMGWLLNYGLTFEPWVTFTMTRPGIWAGPSENKAFEVKVAAWQSYIGFALSLFIMSEWTDYLSVVGGRLCGHGGSSVQLSLYDCVVMVLYTLYAVWHVCFLGRCVWSWLDQNSTVHTEQSKYNIAKGKA